MHDWDIWLAWLLEQKRHYGFRTRRAYSPLAYNFGMNPLKRLHVRMKALLGKYLTVCAAAMFISPSVIAAKEYSSSITWADPVDLAAPVSGFVTSIDVHVGEFVSKNQKLVSVEDRALPSEIAELEARLKMEQISEQLALKELEREKTLYESQVSAAYLLENAQAKYDRAVASKNVILAQLSGSKARLSYSNVTAPYDAIVTYIGVQKYEYVSNGFVLQKLFIGLVRADTLKVTLDLPLEEATLLKHDGLVNIFLDKNKYMGTIWSILEGEKQATKTTIVVKFDLPRNIAGKNLVGKAVRLQFEQSN